jgi:flagellar protein FliO/FliZ
MYSSIYKAGMARIALPAALALAWHVAGGMAQTGPADPEAAAVPLISWRADAEISAEQAPARTAQPVHRDNLVAPAAYSEAVALEKSNDARHLAPQSRGSALPPNRLTGGHDLLPFDISKVESLTTVGAGLAIVVGLFLVCAWLVRRSGPKPTSPLPREAVAVLGRTPLAGSHSAHLVQLGNKLVLVSISPDGVSPLAEVTEPHEVHRLLGMCLRNQKHSSTAEFHQVLEQLAREGDRGFLGDQASGKYARAGRA